MKNRIYFLISFFIVIGFSFLLPNHYYPWVSAYQDFSSFLALAIIFTFFPKEQFILDLKFLFILFISLVPLIQVLSNKMFFLVMV